MSTEIGPARSNRDIFLAAVRISDEAERQIFLNAACGGDVRQGGEIERMLAAHRAGHASPLDRVIEQLVPAETTGQPAANQGADADPSVDVDVSNHPMIGRYKLLEQIGEGGMGTVFIAQQSEPIRRRVALKLIKPGMDSREVISRFQAERQALAMMDHPNIARVLDAGTTAEGRPYFVMELIRGVPITDYCDRQRLSIDDRLRLFIDVCRAVQHAHQKGIIHRDLKPSNVMVTLHDGTPVVKVIDFGVAKALNQELSERTLFTQFSQMIGTPLYMSPEQAEMSGLDIDTRSDVYSLGVLLYELLTGTTPFDKHALSQAGFDEMRRIIREDEPSRPSHKVSTLEAQLLSTVSSRRNIDGRQLALSMRRELDWIAMKALEKDRNRRYESASAMAGDVERYLNDDPVQACPPSAAYRLQKFARRNKSFLGTAAAVAAVLLLAAGVSLWQAVEATAARDLAKAAATAEAEARRQAEANEREAEARRDEIAAVLTFVEERVFSAARPEGQEGGLGRDVRLGHAIAAALSYLEVDFPDQPLIEARLRKTLGISFQHLGEAEAARQQHARAHDLYSSQLGPDHRDTLSSMHSLANSYQALGRREEALALREEALERRQAQLGSDHPDTLSSMHNLANSYCDLGRQEEALALREETLELRQAKLGLDHPGTLKSADHLSAVAFILATHADVNQRDANRAVELARIGVERHPTSPKNWNHLGVALCRADQWQESVEALEKADRMIEDGDRAFRVFVAMAHWQLGNKEKARQRYVEGAAWIAAHRSGNEEKKRFRDEAEQLLGLSETDRRAMIAEFYAATEIDDASTLTDRGRWHQANGDHEKAAEDFTAALRLQPETKDFTVWRSRGLVYYALEQYEQAVSDFSNAIELNADDMWSMKTRGWAYQKLGQLDPALSDLTTCIQRKPSVRYHYVDRARILRDRSEFEAALVDCEKAIAIDPDNDAPYFRRSEAYALRGDIYADNLQQYDQAAQEYEKALQLDPQNAVFSKKRDRAQQAAVDSEPSAVSPESQRPTADTTSRASPGSGLVFGVRAE